MEYEVSEVSHIHILDRTQEVAHSDVAYPFALDELLGRQTGAGGPSVCHLWRHPRAFVIGTKDSRLTGAAEAVRWLKDRGYDVLVRNSGGAAVPLDLGVINVSLIMPIDEKDTRGFHADFERMYVMIRQALAGHGYSIQRGEVVGSYCPGDYDLHIEGLKFCGIAQRRQVRAMIIQAFIIVEGSGAARAELVKAFYDRAGVGADSGEYPQVEPHVMTSLQERTSVRIGESGAFAGLLDSGAFTSAVIRTLQEQQFTDSYAANRTHRLILPEQAVIEDMCAKLRQRYLY
ncbi:lipoate--protein ligase family protein [Cohnella sp. WQ 127256]|uniref:lipoate--protein ligase family protein n=1 Tax=Cohnella sp. WQ 127256 TaxID=2938790 RepID=UPI0021196EDC|nr:lipoate--protein ligase family protein [Cohnella sp. WQ 127256]